MSNTVIERGVLEFCVAVTAPHHLAAQAVVVVLTDRGNTIEAMIVAPACIAMVTIWA